MSAGPKSQDEQHHAQPHPIHTIPIQSRRQQHLHGWFKRILDSLMLGGPLIPPIDRAVRILVHAELASSFTTSSSSSSSMQPRSFSSAQPIGKCPTIDYLQSPFEDRFLHDLRFHIHPNYVLPNIDRKEKADSLEDAGNVEEGREATKEEEATIPVVNTKTLTWETLVQCLERGSFDELVDKKAGMTEESIISIKASLESLALTLVYIAVVVPGACDQDAVKRTFGDLIRKIESKELPIMSKSLLVPGTWERVFQQKCLRFHPSFVQNERHSASHIYWTEIFERLRLEQLARERLIKLDSTKPLTSEQSSRIGGILSCSFFTFIEYHKADSMQVALYNLAVLKEFAPKLPLSWFQDQFLEACVTFGRKCWGIVAATDSSEDHVMAMDGLAAVATVLSCWTRKSATFQKKALASSVVGFLSKCLLEVSTTVSIFEEFLLDNILSLVAAFGKVSDGVDNTIMRTIQSALPGIIGSLSPPAQDNLMTYLAPIFINVPSTSTAILKTTLVNGLAALSGQSSPPARFICIDSHRQPVVPGPFTFDLILKVSYLFEYVTDKRWESIQTELLSSEKVEHGGFGLSVFLKWIVSWAGEGSVDGGVVVEDCPPWMKSVVNVGDENVGVDDGRVESGPGCLAVLAVAIGVWRSILRRRLSLQGGNKQVAKSDLAIPGKQIVSFVQENSVKALSVAMRFLESEYVSNKPVSSPFRRFAAYATSQLSSSLTPQEQEILNPHAQVITRVLQATLFEDVDMLGLEPSIVTISPHDSFATLQQRWTRRFAGNANEKSILQAEFSRMSRALGLFAARSWLDGEHDVVLDLISEMRGFCERVFGIWKSISELFGTIGISLKAEKQELEKILFAYFRLCLFSVTMVSKHVNDAVIETLLEDEHRWDPPAVHWPDHGLWIASSMLVYLQNLHFVSSRYGSDGFKIWTELFDSVVDLLRGAISRDSKFSFVLEELIMALTPAYAGTAVQKHSPETSRLLFYFSVLQRLLPLIPEITLQNEVMPRMFPYFRYHVVDDETNKGNSQNEWKPSDEEKDLFEAVHAICVGIFQNVGRFRDTVKSFAPWYAEMLITNYPEPIDVDLLRRNYAHMIKALSSLSRPYSNVVEVISTEDDHAEAAEDGRREQRGRDSSSEKWSNDEDADLLPSVNELQWIGDEIAWICITKLVNEIVRIADVARTGVSDREVPADSKPSTNSLSVNLANKGVDKRIAEILKAAPRVEMYLRRDSLMTVLFDQIRTIGLRGLQPLLHAIQELMLHGSLKNLVDNGGEMDLDGDSEMEEDAGATSIVGFGVESDPESSPLWKAMASAVGYSRGFDQLRKNYCVSWFLELRHEAKSLRDKLKLSSRVSGSNLKNIKGENGRDVSNVEGKNPPLLRAKL
ncbi:hypothetical protein HDU76_002235 [Blyttiomyces sp. JEL0837]|nr:hypothetical protein HDU76_002235 [Blyttiomyces sp. JEL0837]